MRLLQRLLAILLFMTWLLPMASLALPGVGGGSDAGLPACCRRAGKHHCAMSMGERIGVTDAAPREKAWRSPVERCPYTFAMPASAHIDGLSLLPSVWTLPLVLHPEARVRAAECTWRVARERSRHKRGPPSPESFS